MLGAYYVMPTAKNAKPAWAVALKKRREEVVGSQEELAMRADISQSLVSQIERGVQNPLGVSLERLSRLLQALSWSVNEFSAATGLNLPLMGVPQMQQAHAEYQQQPVYSLSSLLNPSAARPIEHAWLRPGKGDHPTFTRALLIEDTDMERMGRSLHPDDIVLVRTDDITPVNDHLYAIAHDSKVMIRRYVETPIGAAFVADNPNLSGQLLSPSQVTVLGRMYRTFSDFNNFDN
ncbi:LexA family transcriptional regulator [Deinococcus ruber]|uniref:HTH cro/C1-type domain-containing protein n=1 Tax=Deinococcus ruber TaxID=1848197 RepID=A0A918C9I1_9DEIO|nr:LexA family transcriptional regulator [Deinococcus ruber]GGR11628.1 hypothetical protein GCM10008957_25780 [Deinococcus ruber]